MIVTELVTELLFFIICSHFDLNIRPHLHQKLEEIIQANDNALKEEEILIAAGLADKVSIVVSFTYNSHVCRVLSLEANLAQKR